MVIAIDTNALLSELSETEPNVDCGDKCEFTLTLTGENNYDD